MSADLDELRKFWERLPRGDSPVRLTRTEGLAILERADRLEKALREMLAAMDNSWGDWRQWQATSPGTTRIVAAGKDAQEALAEPQP